MKSPARPSPRESRACGTGGCEPARRCLAEQSAGHGCASHRVLHGPPPFSIGVGGAAAGRSRMRWLGFRWAGAACTFLPKRDHVAAATARVTQGGRERTRLRGLAAAEARPSARCDLCARLVENTVGRGGVPGPLDDVAVIRPAEGRRWECEPCERTMRAATSVRLVRATGRGGSFKPAVVTSGLGAVWSRAQQRSGQWSRAQLT